MPKDTQSRKYLLTINNPKDKDLTHEVIKETIHLNLKSILYYCMSDEIGGEEGTHHTHIFIQFSSPVRFSTIKNSFPQAHIDKSRGTAQQNRDYVFKQGKWESSTKSETNLRETHFEWGELPEEKQGRRKDLESLYNDIKDGLTNAQILDSSPQHLLLLNHIDKTRKTVLEEQHRTQWRDLTVTYIWGPTGVGKTRNVMEYYGYQNVYRVTDYRHPFDSYNQQTTLLFDEFDSSIKIRDMLNYLDGYPLELPCRYSNKIACFDKIFIISNTPLEKQYTDEQAEIPEVWRAFLRRIHGVFEMKNSSTCLAYHLLRVDNRAKLYFFNPLNAQYSFDYVANTLDFKSNFNNILLTPQK